MNDVVLLSWINLCLEDAVDDVSDTVLLNHIAVQNLISEITQAPTQSKPQHTLRDFYEEQLNVDYDYVLQKYQPNYGMIHFD